MRGEVGLGRRHGNQYFAVSRYHTCNHKAQPHIKGNGPWDYTCSSMYMSPNGHAEVVKILLSAGADVNDQNEVSSTSPAQ